MLKRFLLWWRSLRWLRYYIIADSNDNSITFSHTLYNHIERHAHFADKAKVFVFSVPKSGTYGFMINPELEQPTQLADIQYNDKYKTIGFESLCPTVARIFCDYRVPLDKIAKLTVSVRKLHNGKLYYNIERP